MSNGWKERSPRERKMVIALAAVVVLGGGMKVMASGGGSPVAVDAGTPHAPVDATVVPPATGSTDGGTEPVKVKHPTGPGSRRDPFEPRITVGSASDSGSTGTTETSEPPAETGSVTVRLEDVYPDAKGRMVAILKLDSTRFRARPGETVADLVTVSELTSRCGVFEQDGGSFALCVGQSTERAR